ncbi:MAG: hypothetical protein JW832_14910 [Deltaproteobacteria bacterium]|nr:hypothetical protein [Deltaproteobacteria bacterium]
MDDLFNHIIGQCSSALQLAEVELPPELARTKYPFNALELVCRNWRAERLRKVYCMRMKVRVPQLDIIGMAFHTERCFDAPIFMFDLSCTKKKIITYINVLAVSDDAAYYEKYMRPFEQVAQRYTRFPPFKMPEWMQVYRTGCTIYTDPAPGFLDELKACVKEYAGLYLPMLTAAEKINDPQRLEAVERFHARFVNDLLTKDRSQIMLGKVIGKEKAGRLFREVLT